MKRQSNRQPGEFYRDLQKIGTAAAQHFPPQCELSEVQKRFKVKSIQSASILCLVTLGKFIHRLRVEMEVKPKMQGIHSRRGRAEV